MEVIVVEISLVGSPWWSIFDTPAEAASGWVLLYEPFVRLLKPELGSDKGLVKAVLVNGDTTCVASLRPAFAPDLS